MAIQTVTEIEKETQNEFNRGFQKGKESTVKSKKRQFLTSADKETYRAGHEFETIQHFPHLYQK